MLQFMRTHLNIFICPPDKVSFWTELGIQHLFKVLLDLICSITMVNVIRTSVLGKLEDKMALDFVFIFPVHLEHFVEIVLVVFLKFYVKVVEESETDGKEGINGARVLCPV